MSVKNDAATNERQRDLFNSGRACEVIDGIETLLPFNRCRCRSRAQTTALSQRSELAIFESIGFGDEPCHFVGGLAVYHLVKRTFRLREFLIVSCIDENIRYKIS